MGIFYSMGAGYRKAEGPVAIVSVVVIAVFIVMYYFNTVQVNDKRSCRCNTREIAKSVMDVRYGIKDVRKDADFLRTDVDRLYDIANELDGRINKIEPTKD